LVANFGPYLHDGTTEGLSIRECGLLETVLSSNARIAELEGQNEQRSQVFDDLEADYLARGETAGRLGTLLAAVVFRSWDNADEEDRLNAMVRDEIGRLDHAPSARHSMFPMTAPGS
jgi:hypothetical protein